jgi:hypothetical protein
MISSSPRRAIRNSLARGRRASRPPRAPGALPTGDPTDRRPDATDTATLTDRLAAELESSRRQTTETAAALRAEVERAADAIRADARYTPRGRLDALGRLETDARARWSRSPSGIARS